MSALPQRPEGARLPPLERDLFTQYTDVLRAPIVVIGRTLGFFEELTEPVSAELLAARVGANPRLTLEWIRAAVASGLVEFDEEGERFRLSDEASSALLGTRGEYNAARIELALRLAAGTRDLLEAFNGNGVSFNGDPRTAALAGAINRTRYETHLIDGYLDVVPGLVAGLEAGSNVAELGSGGGSNLCLLAREFPRSTFVGYEPGESAALAASRIEEAGLDNASIRRAPIEAGHPGEADYAIALEALHECPDPGRTLEAIRPLLKDGGELVVVEVTAGHLADNLSSDLAPALYALSLLHCVPAAGATANSPGALWAEPDVIATIEGSGFQDIRSFRVPAVAPIHTVFAARRE